MRLILTALAAAILTAGCNTTPTPPAPTLPPGDPTATVWIAGDSIGRMVGDHTTGTYNAAVPGAGFTVNSIEARTNLALDAVNGHPTTIVVFGGVNDWLQEATGPAVIDAMAHFAATMTARGATVRFALEPTWRPDTTGFMATVWRWQADQPGAIDCRGDAGATSDGIHPSNPAPLAQCIMAHLS